MFTFTEIVFVFMDMSKCNASKLETENREAVK